MVDELQHRKHVYITNQLADHVEYNTIISLSWREATACNYNLRDASKII